MHFFNYIRCRTQRATETPSRKLRRILPCFKIVPAEFTECLIAWLAGHRIRASAAQPRRFDSRKPRGPGSDCSHFVKRAASSRERTWSILRNSWQFSGRRIASSRFGWGGGASLRHPRGEENLADRGRKTRKVRALALGGAACAAMLAAGTGSAQTGQDVGEPPVLQARAAPPAAAETAPQRAPRSRPASCCSISTSH